MFEHGVSRGELMENSDRFLVLEILSGYLESCSIGLVVVIYRWSYGGGEVNNLVDNG